MIKSKRGQTLGITIVALIFVFIIGMMTINFLFDEVSTFRVNLNCADAAAITDGTKLLCLVVDTSIPYWIFLIFSITIGAVVARMYL